LVGSIEKRKKVEMIQTLWESLLQLLSNIILFIGQLFTVGGKMIALPGFLGLAIGLILFAIAYKKTEHLLGSLLLLGGAGLTVFIIVSYLLWPFLFKGSENSVTSCYKAAGTNIAAVSICDSISSGFVPPSTTPGEQTPVVVVPPTDPDDQQVVRTFKANALEILILGWNLKPPGTTNLINPADVPQGIMLSFECDNPIATRQNEVWKVTISGIVPGLGQKSLVIETNGYFARDGFKAKPGTSVVGTGTWEEVCPSCYTDVVVTPPPQPTPTPAPAPATTQVAFPELICGYWGWLLQSGNALVVPTTGGQPDFAHAVSQAAAAADIAKRCPGETLPAPP